MTLGSVLLLRWFQRVHLGLWATAILPAESSHGLVPLCEVCKVAELLERVSRGDC